MDHSATTKKKKSAIVRLLQLDCIFDLDYMQATINEFNTILDTAKERGITEFNLGWVDNDDWLELQLTGYREETDEEFAIRVEALQYNGVVKAENHRKWVEEEAKRLGII